MCGLFGFTGSVPDSRKLAGAIGAAQRRGPHGTGAFFDDNHWCETGKPDPARIVSGLAGSSLVIGHARLATFGRYADLDGLQPVLSDGLVYAHNGNVYNWQELAGDADCPSDSFALSGLLGACRMDRAVDRIETDAIAIAVKDQHGLYLYRKHLPLHVLREPEGTYWCSWPLDGWMPIPEDKVYCL